MTVDPNPRPWTPEDDLILVEGVLASFEVEPRGLIGPVMAQLRRSQPDCLGRFDELVKPPQTERTMREVVGRLRGAAG